MQQTNLEDEIQQDQEFNDLLEQQINQDFQDSSDNSPLTSKNQKEDHKNNNDIKISMPSSKEKNKKSPPRLTSEQVDKLVKKRKICGLVQGCDSIENFEHLNRIHEGVYGIVFRARDKITNDIYAIKKVKMQKELKEGFPITTIREINLLLGLKHENIVGIKEIVHGSGVDKVYIVMEYMEHELKQLLESIKYNLSWGQLKALIKQLLMGLEYLHSKNIIHRDLKPSNLLYNNEGILKICDLGLARKYNPSKCLTPVVVTLWYRAPELLLGMERYTKAIDIWSVGCIFAELLLKEAFLQGKNETEQIDLIFRTLGSPSDSTWPGWRDLKFARTVNFPNYQGNSMKSYKEQNQETSLERKVQVIMDLLC